MAAALARSRLLGVGRASGLGDEKKPGQAAGPAVFLAGWGTARGAEGAEEDGTGLGPAASVVSVNRAALEAAARGCAAAGELALFVRAPLRWGESVEGLIFLRGKRGAKERSGGGEGRDWTSDLLGGQGAPGDPGPVPTRRQGSCVPGS